MPEGMFPKCAGFISCVYLVKPRPPKKTFKSFKRILQKKLNNNKKYSGPIRFFLLLLKPVGNPPRLPIGGGGQT